MAESREARRLLKRNGRASAKATKRGASRCCRRKGRRRAGRLARRLQIRHGLDQGRPSRRWAEHAGRPFLRFDYSGHGGRRGVSRTARSGAGSTRRSPSCAVPRRAPILVGSSMGGWIALARGAHELARNAASPAGLVLIAPAVDFTEALMWKELPPEARREIEEKGVYGCGLPPIRRSPTRSRESSSRRGAAPDASRRHDPARVPGPYPARHARSGRALAPRPDAHGASRRRRRASSPWSATATTVSSREEDLARLVAAIEGLEPN